ncbi:polysaccharide deacetylase family protein [Candidatus Micrarchaeota archaeon]|nr:polysaccharide deacetylase family protein [Candidatus Micrarchaeota archaeon]
MALVKDLTRGIASAASPLLFALYFKGAPKHSWKEGKVPVTISFDYDFKEDEQAIPALLELFGSYGFPASHACRGDLVQKNPSAYAKLVDANHEIINHTQNHPENFNELSKEEKKREIAACHDTIKSTLGVEPNGFRTPHFGKLHSPDVYEALEELGYLYSSSTNLTRTKSFGVPYYPSKKDFLRPGEPSYKVLELSVMSCPEHYFPVFDSWHCFENPGAHSKPGRFRKVFELAVQLALKHSLYLNTYFDPRHVAGNKDFAASLDLLRNSRLRVVRSCDICPEF